MTGAALSGKKYKAYPEYKESGVEWVGEIPSDWSMWKLAHAFNEIGSGTTPPTNNEKWFKGDVPWITTGELREKIITDTKKKLSPSTLKAFPTLKKYPVGSIAIAMYGATIGRLGIFGVEAATNQACCVMTTSTQLNNKYLFYWLWAFKEDIIRLSSGGGQPNINQEKVASLRVSAPKSKEQQKIASFLDHETAKIDTLIAKQEKLIELLKEKRQAVISHAVTKGLNPQAPMRDSGVEWLGEVPEHWFVVPIKRMCEVKDGTHDTPKYVDKGENSFPLITSKDFEGKNISFESAKYISKEAHREIVKRSNTEVGDVLMSMIGGNIGKALIVKETAEFSIKNVALFKTTRKSALASYILYYLESGLLDIQISLQSRGGAQGFLSLGDLRNLVFFKVPEDELNTIVEHLDLKIFKYDRLINIASDKIALLSERKTALISAAVTGKVDVRDWKPQGV